MNAHSNVTTRFKVSLFTTKVEPFGRQVFKGLFACFFMLAICSPKAFSQIDSTLFVQPTFPEKAIINPLKPIFPDTLVFHDFILVVEKYTGKGLYNKKQNEYQG